MVNGWLMDGWLVVSNMNGCICPFHIWDVIRNPLTNSSYFSRWLLHHQPDMFFDVFFRKHMRKHMIFHMKFFYCWSFGSNVDVFFCWLVTDLGQVIVQWWLHRQVSSERQRLEKELELVPVSVTWLRDFASTGFICIYTIINHQPG
jgi:hypothetical protein